METVVIPAVGPLIAQIGVGMALVVLFAIYVLRTWRDGKTTERTQNHLARALEFAEQREARLTERIDEILGKLIIAEHEREQAMQREEEAKKRVEAMTAQIAEIVQKLKEAEQAREEDRMLWETKLEANEHQLEEAIARIADAERQRDEIANRASRKETELQKRIEELQTEVQQLRKLVSRRTQDLGPPDGSQERRNPGEPSRVETN